MRQPFTAKSGSHFSAVSEEESKVHSEFQGSRALPNLTPSVKVYQQNFGPLLHIRVCHTQTFLTEPKCQGRLFWGRSWEGHRRQQNLFFKELGAGSTGSKFYSSPNPFSPITRDRTKIETRGWCQTTCLVKTLQKICILTYLGHDLTFTWPWPDLNWGQFLKWSFKVKKYMFQTASSSRFRIEYLYFHE